MLYFFVSDACLYDDGLGWVWSPTRIITMSRCTAYIRLQSCVQRLSHVPCTLATRIIVLFSRIFAPYGHPTGWIVDVVHPFLRTPDVATLCRRCFTEKWSATLCRGGFPFQSIQFFFFSFSDQPRDAPGAIATGQSRRSAMLRIALHFRVYGVS